MRRMWLAISIVPASAVAWLLVLPPAPLAQPTAFNHAAHSRMSCRVCHTGVEVASRAHLPTAATCARCHAAAPRGIQTARWNAMQQAGAPAWPRVTRAPEHVYFSHNRHVTQARLDCSSCHGDIGQRATPPGRPPLRLDMDACIGCHRRERANDDCAGCHR